ncbi:D-alanyl-D-alanine carboxypeptidase [Neorhizobium sp. NCHU2750]|uniref:SPOR domain-containing protein n=1 Tax=Neorhizobium sp. NCHU2750 TaxID=1825976 RepID=UPI000E770905
MFSASFPKAAAKTQGKRLGCLLAIALSLTALAPAAHADPKYAGIVVDAKTGKVLYGEDPDGLRYPASLTKMMTLYLTFEALEAHRFTLDTLVPVSAHAAGQAPTKLGVRPGGKVTVDQAIRAIVTRSANDMATALGEMVAGGSEDRFAQIMTAKARALGMTRTNYRNANGLPNTAAMTTARDQARLGIALRQHFPQYYGYFSIRSFTFGRQVIGNHNRLVGTVAGVDGIKTGYTRAAGSNLATSAQLDGRSIVAVILGGRSSAARDAQMRKLVAEYLPKASRGGTSNLISQAAPAAPAMPVPRTPAVAAVSSEGRQASAFDLPNSGPLPDTRYDRQPKPPMEVAAAYTGESAQSRSASEALAAAAPEPQTRREGAAMKRDLAEENVDDVTTASTRASSRASSSAQAMSGWVIQIGVSPSEKMALDLLQNAQDKGGKVLRSAKPFTVAFNSNGGQIYRARFGGFDDQKTAVDACTVLKRKGVSCWASAQ